MRHMIVPLKLLRYAVNTNQHFLYELQKNFNAQKPFISQQGFYFETLAVMCCGKLTDLHASNAHLKSSEYCFFLKLHSAEVLF